MSSRPSGHTYDYRKNKRSRPCGYLVMQGAKTILDRSSVKFCPNYHPHELAAKQRLGS